MKTLEVLAWTAWTVYAIITLPVSVAELRSQIRRYQTHRAMLRAMTHVTEAGYPPNGWTCKIDPPHGYIHSKECAAGTVMCPNEARKRENVITEMTWKDDDYE